MKSECRSWKGKKDEDAGAGTPGLFPEKASWLDTYLSELLAFPSSKYDDQVDSTVNALTWLTEDATKPGMAIFLLEKMRHEQRMRELAGKR